MPAYSRILLPWDSQPQETTDFSDAALGEGLSAYYDGRTGRMVLPGSQSPTVSGTAFAQGVSQAGVGRALAGNGALSFPWNSAYGSGTDLSLCITVVRTGSYSIYDRLLEFGGYLANNGWGIESDAAGTGLNFIPWTSGTPFPSLGTLPLWQPVTIVVRRGGSTRADHFVNGVRTADTAVNPLNVNTSHNLCIGGQRADPTSNRIGNIILLQAAIFSNRYVADGFAQDLSLFPYQQLFAPRSIWVPVSAGGGNTAALANNLSTTASGILVPALSLATTGNSATASTGTLTPALSRAITGNAATASTGTSVASISLALTGNGATTAAGDVAVAGADPALTGSTATSSVGDVSPGITIALAGNGATASVGDVSPAISLALSGLAGTSAAGIVVPGLDLATTGNTATSAVGNVSPGGDVTLALTGNAATASAGTLSIGGPLTDAEFRQMYDWLQDLYGRQLLTVGTYIALK